MNQIVEYLEKHHNPGGNAVNHIRVDDLLLESGWSRAEIYQMALLDCEDRILTMTKRTGYRVGDNDPDGLDIIGIWNEVYRKIGTGATNKFYTCKRYMKHRGFVVAL